jgi:hypothetical protein
VQESKEGIKMNGTHQLLGCVGNVNLLGKNIHTIQKNRAPVDTSKEVSPEIKVNITSKATLIHRI